MAACPCSGHHSPRVVATDTHHVVPLSWGGPSTADNRVELCPTTHHQVHRLIDAYVSADGIPPGVVRHAYNTLTQDLAARAWAQRPANPTRTSLEAP